MSRRSVPALCLILLLSLSGCSPAGGEAVQEFFAMDTLMRVQLSGPKAEAAVQAAVAEVNRLDRLLSRTGEDSDVARINAHAGDGGEVTVSQETAVLLAQALEASAATGGAFDVTIAPVMDAWGFGTSEAELRVPAQDELSALLPLVDSGALHVDTTRNTARLDAPGAELDLGGIAKGYAADRLMALLSGYDVSSALLNLGSSTIAALGTRPDGGPWRIALRDPQDEDGQLLVLALSDQVLSTSGGYERFFEADGVVYHHILDPETGMPARSGLLSVTVVSDQGAEADALSTALYVMGPEQALGFWRTRDTFECILCLDDGTVLVTEGLEDAVTFKGDVNGYTCEIVRR